MDIEEIWNYIPHISGYQIVLTFIMGYFAMISGFIAQSVIFMFYEPTTRCRTVMDDWINDNNTAPNYNWTDTISMVSLVYRYY